jgi:hypothetical protein
MLSKLFLDALRCRIGGSTRGLNRGNRRRGARRRSGLRGHGSCSRLDLTDGQLAGHDLVRQLQLTALVLDWEEGARVTSGDMSPLNQLPHSWL